MSGPWEKYAQAAPSDGPWSKYQDTSKTPNPPIPLSPVESALRGAEQGATFGFGDEARGALGAVKDVATDDYHLSDLMDRYRLNRDQARQLMDRARSENPKSYMAGEVAGSIGSSFIPGLGALGAAKGATLGARALSAAQGGAVLGGLTGLGTSQADLTKGDFGQAANDVQSGATTGAVAGGLLTPAIEGVASGVKNFINPENLKNLAADRAVKATTGQNISAIRKIANAPSGGQDIGLTEEALRKTGRNLLDSGVIGFGDSVEDLAPKLAAKRQEVGSQIGALGDQVDQLKPNSISGQKIANDILAYADSIPKTGSGKALYEKLANEAQNISDMGELSFAKAQEVKNQFKYKPESQDALISSQDATNKIKGLISDNMESAVANADPELLGQYTGLKDQYGTFKNTSQAASDRVLKDLSVRTPSPSDYAMGATGAVGTAIATGGHAIPTLALGALAGGINHVARLRGNSAVAVGLNSAANAIEGAPGLVNNIGSTLYQSAQRGGPAQALTHELLTKDASKPGYKVADNLGETLKSNPEKFGKFAAPLQAAAERGPTSLAATNFVLQQTNPDYRSIMFGKDDENDDH